MKRIAALALLFYLAAQLPATATPMPDAESIVSAVRARLAGISGYTADIEVHIQLRSFPFLSTTLRGTAAYKRPGGFTVSLPQSDVARSYQDALNDLADPMSWRNKYDVTLDHSASQPPSVVALRFTPKAQADVDHAIAIIERNTWTIRQIDWFYADGGHARIVQSFSPVRGLLMISHQSIDVAMTRANFTADASLDNYAIAMQDKADVK